MYNRNRENFRRGVNHSSLFLPLDATIPKTGKPSRDHDRGDGDPDLTGEDTLGEEEKSEGDFDEKKVEEVFMSIGVDFGTTYAALFLPLHN